MDQCIQPLYDIVKIMCTPICGRVDYARNLSKNFTELSTKVKELCCRRDDIKHRIDLVKLQKAPTSECKEWLASLEKIEKQVKEIKEKHVKKIDDEHVKEIEEKHVKKTEEKHVKKIEDEQHIDMRCFKGWFPDVIARAKLGKHVVDMIEWVNKLEVKSKFEGGFVTDLPPQVAETRPVDPLIMGTSTNVILEKLLDSIGDEGVQKIGIWGMGGVGKTTLMKHLNNMPEIQETFQIVIWVTVSKSWSIRKIQDEVAMRLSLPDVKDKSDDRVSIMLSQKLEGKKYLLLLDDVWEWVDLSQVGIPSTSQEKGCKIVLTSRDEGVCRRMKTDVNIPVKVLDEKEAWELFMSQAGEVSCTCDIKPIADEIVRKCDGLPLALKVAGGALRKVGDVYVWRDFLNRLNSPCMSDENEEMYKEVFKPLKVSYDELKDVNIKHCFLYCGLYPEDEEIKISQLITYWRAEGFLRKGSLKDAYEEGRAKLHKLIGASLLEKCEDENHVKMHDVIRDLVLKMTSAGGEESRFMVRAGQSLSPQEIPDDKEWEEASKISFMYAEGYRLPQMPNCPNLSTLLFQSRYYNEDEVGCTLKAIPECFFNHMPNLGVLDLSGSGISTLPSSILNLVNLRALLMKQCRDFKGFPDEISALQKLEVLHVSGASEMRYQPIEIWKLRSLKSLKFWPFPLEVEGKEEIVPSVTISRLSLLEESSIRYFQESVEDFEKEKSVEAFEKDVGSLTRLSSLKFHFRTKNGLKHFLHDSQPWRKGAIRKFYFTVAKDDERSYLSKTYERRVVFNPVGVPACDEGVPSEIKEVLKRSEFLLLKSCKTLGILSADLGVKNVNGLKGLNVSFCSLEYIVDGDGLRGDAFENLELLLLAEIDGLRSICCDRLPMQLSSNSFTKLKKLYIIECYPMKKVFSWGLILQLLNLELLEISGSIFSSRSMELEEIISAAFDDEEDDRLEHVKLPKLKILRLYYLPKFIGFSKRKHLYLHCPSLEEVTFYKCPKLEIFPFANDSAPNLSKIEGQQEWWEALKWEGNATKSRFSPLFQ